MKKVLLSISALFLIFLSACTKEVDDIDIDVSKDMYLYESYWQITSILQDLDHENELTSPIEIFFDMNQCYRDNIYFFETTDKFFIDESFLKCNAATPDVTTMYYDISNNDSYLKIWSNPEEPDASVYLDGTIKTVNIKKFLVEKITYNTVTEKFEFRQYTFEASRPMDKK